LSPSQIYPLDDPRWAEFVGRHPHASIFHTVAWLDALRQTYGYQPIAFTTSPPGTALENGLVLCRVASWITGRRLVSLPFSDHCEPLLGAASDQQLLFSALEQTLRGEKLRYVEVRPLNAAGPWSSSGTYCFHQLDLRPDLKTLLSNCHKSSTQRKIIRAGQSDLTAQAGHTETLLNAFWDLLLMTRRRHGIPPQPKTWFRNLIHCFGDALQIRVAYRDQRPVASILTIRHKSTLVYKYGCSDARFHSLGGTQFLFWRAIQDAKRDGLETLDLGRTDWDNRGLLKFKDRLGSTRSTLVYSRFPGMPYAESPDLLRGMTRLGTGLVPHLPAGVLRLAGRVLYRHIA
jgi:CelD/BcsL family acetyltransferase involved in cellulose biosynthesis